MKKYFYLLMTLFIMSMSLTTSVSAFKASEYQEEVYEDFENEDISTWNVGGEGNQFRLNIGLGKGLGGSNCAEIRNTGTSTQASKMFIKAGRTYRITGWIKLLENLDSRYAANNYLSFIFSHPSTSRQVNHEYLPLSTQNWTKFQIDFAYTGYLDSRGQVHTGDCNVDVLMRICDPTISFLLDDLSIDIIADNSAPVAPVDVANGQLIKQGDFEQAFDANCWDMTDVESVTSSYFGAKNTMTAGKINMLANGSFGQTVTTTQGATYNGEYYTKTDDTAVVPTFYADGAEVTETTTEVEGWTKHEFSYTAQNSQTEFYWLNAGTENVEFYLDEFKVDQAETVSSTLQVANIEAIGKLLPGEQLTFNWSYNMPYSGKSTVRVYRYVDGNWIGYDSFIAQGNINSYSLNLTSDMIGNKLKIDIMPIEAAAGTNVREVYYVTQAICGEFEITPTINDGSNVTTEIKISNFSEQSDVLATLCLFDSNNTLLDCDSVYINSELNTIKIYGETLSCTKTMDSETAVLFIWDGVSLTDNTGTCLIESVEITLE